MTKSKYLTDKNVRINARNKKLLGDHPFKYLIQVWREKDAAMLYERKLRSIPKGWGTYKEHILYQEQKEGDSRFEIYCITVKESPNPLVSPKEVSILQSFSL